jgi:SAM-dependent methyltransferase
MLHQRTRDVYFTALRRLNKLNYWRWKIRGAHANGSGAPHLHLGCGPKYLSGFINVDGNLLRKRDVWLDLRNGLPFASDSIASIYSSHVFEHFYAEELSALLRECHRVLSPEGFMRTVVPDLRAAARAYIAGDASFFAISRARTAPSAENSPISFFAKAAIARVSIFPTSKSCCSTPAFPKPQIFRGTRRAFIPPRRSPCSSSKRPVSRSIRFS